MRSPRRVGRLARELHAPAHQLGRPLAIEAALGEALERRLVARGDRDVGAGGEVVRMHGADQVRILQQEAGRPQRVAQVGAAPLELGREPAVEHQRAAEPLPHVHALNLADSPASPAWSMMLA